MKLEKKQEKALKELQEVKAIEAKQEVVKINFEKFTASEEAVQILLQGLRTSREVGQACQDFRIASTSAVQALAEKVFTSQQEMANFLGFDKNKMSRIVKCGKVFQKFTSEELAEHNFNELDIKAESHDNPKVITDLLNDGDLEEVTEAKEEAKVKAPSKKFTKAVSNMVELLGDSNLTKEERFAGFMQIKASAGLNLQEQMSAQIEKEVKAYQDIVTGKKAKANA